MTTPVSFKKLQKGAEDAGIKGVPADRSQLKDLHTTTEADTIGEGSVVEFSGFLIKGRFSNVGTGETVYCKLPDLEENDIHLNIVPDKPPVEPTKKQLEDLECQSVVAEISPHFRPERWEPLGTLVKTTANASAAKKIAALDLRRPMRFTGHLFFDGSHKPCTGRLHTEVPAACLPGRFTWCMPLRSASTPRCLAAHERTRASGNHCTSG